MGQTDGREKLLILTGPTAVGKTKLSIALAQALSGEIISADSMQVYRGMDIGTDKIRPENMGGVPHHLIDILDPTEEFNVFLFERLALQAIEQIRARGHLPVIVGGTGFYIQSVLYHVDFTDRSDGGAYRQSLMQRIGQGSEEELLALHSELEAIDPDSAAAIHAHNVKRVIRALEYHHLTGECISRHNDRERVKPPAFDALYFVLTDDREKLYARINARVDEMLAQGLEDEVRGLIAGGLTGAEVSMQGLGYRQMAQFLRGELTREEAAANIKRDTRHFAKRQLTWFRREREVRFLDRRLLPTDDLMLGELLRQCKEAWSS